MKKFIVTSILLVITMAGFSQTEKGSWLLGGNISYSTSSQTSSGEKVKFQTFDLNPKIGFFAVNNLALILNTNYMSVSANGFSDHTLTIGPAARYYFTGSESVKFFVGAGVGFGSGSDTHGTLYQFEAGPAFFITPAVALELNINYQTGNSKTDTDMYNYKTDVSQFGVGFGFIIYLGKGKK